MYCLQAVIATTGAVLREVADARVVPLGQGLWLLPMTDAVFDAIAIGGAGGLDAFWKAPAGLDRLLSAGSRSGPIAYVEADYFGGVGTQTAQVWDGGIVVLGPLDLPAGQSPPAAGTPISRALRRLGAVRGEHADEFDAVGLGRHRDTDDWLSATDRPEPGDRHT